MAQVSNSMSDSGDQLPGGLSVFGLIRRLWVYFRPDQKACAAVVALVILNAVLSRGIVVLFGWAIDRGLIAKDISVLIWCAAVYCVLQISVLSLQASVATWFARIGNRVLYRLRDHLVSHVQSLPAAYFDRVPSGRIVTRMTSDTVSLTELFNQGLLNVFSSVISIITIVVAMAVISVKLTLLTLLVAPPMIYLAFRLSDRILIVQREAKKHVSTINAFVAETISRLRVIQLFNKSKSQRERFETLSTQYKAANLKTVSLYALFYPTVSLFTATSVATALYLGGELTASKLISAGAMVAFIFLVKDFGDPLRNLLERYQLLQNSVSSGERIFSLLAETPESVPEFSQTITTPLHGRLVFKNVSFRYEDSPSAALDDLSFELETGKTMAVIGRTGSGKSTLISLLQRFRDPSEGMIFLDDIDLGRVDRRAIRKLIGVVQQDVFLFRGTIADNIGLQDSTISRERILWAAGEAGLERLIAMRPGGLDAIVEERGQNLSLGERQLIAFARILAFDPQILVLDEATASVDSETEALLQDATARARCGRTSIIIAHRLSTIADADQILVLEKGRIVEMGSPRELLAQDGAYKKMALAYQDCARIPESSLGS